jgi:formate-dependent nitrite reductase membrane component NrfD
VTEQPQVPPAEFRSYYGRPILKVTRWKEPHLPAYLFLGELSGALAMVGAVAHATGHRSVARTARLVSVAAAAGGGAFLTSELGRPERFLNMLRVAKPTSPMSMGSWTLALHSGLVSASAASEVTGLLSGLGSAAGALSAVTGSVLATYPGVLLANTAVPAWHDAYRELPLLFAGGAMTAAGAAGLAASAVQRDRAEFGAAYRLALIGAGVESLAGYALETRPGPAAEAYRKGNAGRVLAAARYLTLSGGLVSLGARRSRAAAALSAALLTGGGLCAKFAVLRAGVASAADPQYVVATQQPGVAGDGSVSKPARADRPR